MRGSMRPVLGGAAALCLALGACQGGAGGNDAGGNAADEAALTGEDQLVADPELLNEAAADEAADMGLYGGNAAAGETGNMGVAATGNGTGGEAAANLQ